jgi:6-phosphogluconate dehydrogenase
VKLAMIGLGRMGGNMTRRLARAGLEVVAFDASPDSRTALADESGVQTVDSAATLVSSLAAPRVVWVMLPAGEITESVIEDLAGRLSTGDLVVDGGNANYRDSQRRAASLANRGIDFVDAGVSGGVWGLTEGYGLMVGGTDDAITLLTPVLQALAPTPDTGWVHAGPAGAGHFTKMVHNGIEYGLMQAYAEGFAVLQARADLVPDIASVAEAWRYGTVIRSWLLDLTASVLAADSSLDGVAPVVADSGEGRWTALEAIDLGVPTPVITASLMQRFSSQGRGDYSDKLLAMMRNAFGGHPVEPESGSGSS